jgi:dihydroxy-acid dehydratase
VFSSIFCPFRVTIQKIFFILVSFTHIKFSLKNHKDLHSNKKQTAFKNSNVTGSEIMTTSNSTLLNRYSKTITQPKSQGASQAMLYATGLSSEDLNKAQVCIASMWFEGNPCNMHLLDLSEQVKIGVREADLIPMRCNTIGVSDGISMGTDGMSFSLQSRDLIADSIETIMQAQWYDGLIALPGCDKNMPGCLIAMGRLNRPSLMIYGGTIGAGCAKGKVLDVISAFQSYGEFISGAITEEDRQEIVRHSCPGAGACGGMYTANTMASAIEALGMSLPFNSSIPANHPAKQKECLSAGAAIRTVLEKNILPREIMTKAAFENALTVVSATGGSTNAVLHLLAIARSVGVELSLDDVQQVSNRVPLLCDLKPSGKYLMEDLHKIGGIPAVMKSLLEAGLLDGTCLTVTGRSLQENLADCAPLSPDQVVVRPLTNPIKKTGHIQILQGNLAPQGSVAKITGKEGSSFSGTARVFDSEETMVRALEEKKIQKGDVIVIRYEGPKGGPGMPEMLTPTSAIMGAGLGQDVALITDGRFSGGSHGFIVGHITPEAQEGGPIALVKNGDTISIDSEKRTIKLDISEQELSDRRKTWIMPPYKAKQGTLYKYIKNVSQADKGCVTDE